VSTAEDHGGETVPSALCNQAEIPDVTQKCSLYCPSECAVSDWGQWSKCPQVGSPAGVSVAMFLTRWSSLSFSHFMRSLFSNKVNYFLREARLNGSCQHG